MLGKSKFLALRNFLLLILVVSLLFLVGCGREQKIPAPPETKVIDVKDTLHGVEISDPYRWLEDQESPETRDWINAQNKYADSLLGSVPGREELKTFLSSLIKIDTISIPLAASGRYFFSKRRADQELSVIYMREGRDGEDQVLIDPHPLSEDKTVSVGMLDISQDGTLLAYGVRKGGEDEIEIKLFDVNGRKDQEFPQKFSRVK